MSKLFDFSGRESNERALQNTWAEFRHQLADGKFKYNEVEKAMHSTFLRVFDDLFQHGHRFLEKTVAETLSTDISIVRAARIKPGDPYGADGVLVIQNPQGAGKTLLFSKLALYADWFAEGISIDLDKKDSVIQATGCWIAELGELDSTLKREQLSLKAFITSRTDTYRQPYARAATRKPRRTSFCATVNPTEFLNDETGSKEARKWLEMAADYGSSKAMP